MINDIESDLHVFVYGTLKTGEPNHYWFEDTTHGESQLVGPGHTVERFPLVIATQYNLPMLLDQAGTGKSIKGEIYKIDAAKLKHLDILEAYPSLYTRRVVQVNLDGEGTALLHTWVYLIDNFREELLDNDYVSEYSAKIHTWDPAYLDNKDGDFLYDALKKPKLSKSKKES